MRDHSASHKEHFPDVMNKRNHNQDHENGLNGFYCILIH